MTRDSHALEFGAFYKVVCKSTFYEPIYLNHSHGASRNGGAFVFVFIGVLC